MIKSPCAMTTTSLLDRSPMHYWIEHQGTALPEPEAGLKRRGKAPLMLREAPPPSAMSVGN